jgi:UDP-glucose 4-epimerase
VRVLITGASGAVAQAVIAELAPDHELVLTARRHPREAGHSLPTELPFVRADLTEREACRRLVDGIDALAHIGANNWYGADTFRTNTLSTYYLAEAAREAGIKRFVFASSNCALGHCTPVAGRFLPQQLPIDESEPSRVEEEYGLSKLVNEETLAAYARSCGLESYALRLAWCWGEAEYSWRLDKLFDSAEHRGGFWAYVDMRDVAQAFRKALHAAPLAQAACVPLYINAADTMAAEPSADLIAQHYPQLAAQSGQLRDHESIFSWRAAQAAIGYEPQCSWR